MRLLFQYLFLICPVIAYSQSRISFIEEYIDFELNSKYFKINGLYVFVNPTNHALKQNINFPFALETELIDSIRLYNLSENIPVEYKSVDKGIIFKIRIEPSDTIRLNIAYQQKLKRENVYILKSTKSWGEPLKKAKYTLLIWEPIEIEETSYKPDLIQGNIYSWQKENFMPDKNFIVRIKAN